MNNNLSIDVNMLADAPAATLLSITERHQSAQRAYRDAWALVTAMPDLFRTLESLDVTIRFDPASEHYPLNLSFSGDGEKFAEVWGLLRRAGFSTDKRPEKGMTGFQNFWKHPEFKGLYLTFFATACRRIQVGVQMVEQPIYETVCGDLPMLDAPETALVPA